MVAEIINHAAKNPSTGIIMASRYIFEGFLERFETKNEGVEIRLSTGQFDPAPREAPILYIYAKHPENIAALATELNAILLEDDYVYVEEIAESEILIHSNLETPTIITAREITTRLENYEACDFEFLAYKNYALAMQYHEAQSKANEKIHVALQLSHNQMQRLAVKCNLHETGSTPHTLYAQQLLFLQRIVEALK
ncbi:hypothetical protein ABHF33_06500 [Chitinibacter sp. FCG-7]|uniref:Uncharacterized protein n=1 Tax=Chitinibacter mangrovi TaxID=3153927 RepID=A0AAU7FB02_9NEIS